MQFGSEGREFSLCIDSGSPDTWVAASNCVAPGCDTRIGFGPEYSNTLNVTNKDFFVGYGPDMSASNVSGKIAQDDVTLAGLTFEMSFGLATEAPVSVIQQVHTAFSPV
jgi:hypothetical protein